MAEAVEVVKANWKTTVFGLGAFLPGIIEQIAPIFPKWYPILSGLSGILALIFAKDASNK